jgi:hypothetical protein
MRECGKKLRFETPGLFLPARRDKSAGPFCPGFTLDRTLGKINRFMTTRANVLPVKFVGKDFFFLPAIRALTHE